MQLGHRDDGCSCFNRPLTPADGQTRGPRQARILTNPAANEITPRWHLFVIGPRRAYVRSNTSSMTRRNILSTSMPGYVRCFASPRLTRPHAQAAISVIVRCVPSYHYAYTQCQCLTPDTVWYLATVPFPQAGMPRVNSLFASLAAD
jgi:hypothetical protein